MIRIFHHYISGIYLVLFFLELIVFGAAFFLGNLLRFYATGQSLVPVEQLTVPSIIYAVIMPMSAAGMGLYRRAHDIGDAALLLRILASFLLGTAAISIVFFVFPKIFVGRGVFGYTLLVALTGMLLCR
ncbi:MAG: sugar transferase, system associated subfamily, partial [Proteobacteria bacterium]|nr:sugar transferase, system associated subfamily [Pseudomonadota bacterium]